jgi:hypothetical protein
MSDPVVTPRRRGFAAAIPIGLSLLAVTFAWWFFYYSQYDGPSKQLDLKAPCFAVTSEDCLTMQKHLLGSMIPAYHPVLFWAGAIILGIGIAQQVSRWR